jgi:hypothetical protein
MVQPGVSVYLAVPPPACRTEGPPCPLGLLSHLGVLVDCTAASKTFFLACLLSRSNVCDCRIAGSTDGHNESGSSRLESEFKYS